MMDIYYRQPISVTAIQPKSIDGTGHWLTETQLMCIRLKATTYRTVDGVTLAYDWDGHGKLDTTGPFVAGRAAWSAGLALMAELEVTLKAASYPRYGSILLAEVA